MLLFYFNCMYKGIKSLYKASDCVEIVFGQNFLVCTFIWPKCLWPKCPGQNVCGQNVPAKMSNTVDNTSLSYQGSYVIIGPLTL